MYKISVNECPLFLTKNAIKADKILHFKSPQLFDMAVDLLWNHSAGSVNIYHSDVQALWKSFRKRFKYIEAAGGLTRNATDRILFIHRLGKWDLPKGKVEKDETPEQAAIREVEEECGISNLKITKRLKTTYHIYYDQAYILKAVHWYEMYTQNTSPLRPQKEENILKVVWKNPQETTQALDNTYESIRTLFDELSSKTTLKIS